MLELRRAPPRTWSTRCGCTQTPLFASAPYIAAIWIGVTAIPWPIGTLPIVEPDHRSRGSTIPRLSPGKSIPVFSPNPNREIQAASRFEPRSCASMTVPMFDERASISETDIVSVGRGLGLVDRAVGDLDRRRQRERRVRRDDAAR